MHPQRPRGRPEREASPRAQRDRLAAVGQLAAGVAHDFNNIVTAVSLYAELLEEQPSLDADGRRHLGAMRQQLERAAALVWQILDFANRDRLHCVEVDLVSFLDELLPVLRRTLPDHVAITRHNDAGPYVVRADPTRLQQIFLNLATNAKHAFEGAGELSITLSVPGAPSGEAFDDEGSVGPWVRIDVGDTGSGMPTEVLERVFEPFFTTKPPGEGTGLGLAQVHGLVSQHEGHIEIDSSAATGTKVSIWLPTGHHGEVSEGPVG